MRRCLAESRASLFLSYMQGEGRSQGELPLRLVRVSESTRVCDPPRKTEPEEAGNFILHGSVSARLAGTIAFNVTQVMVSSKSVETGA